MSTPSNIVMVSPDGKTATKITCHWDGYPSWNGKVLLENYTTEEKVKQLVKLGDLSTLGPEIGTKHDFDHPPKNECNYYHRDRGEPWSATKPQTVKLNPADGEQGIAALQDEDYLYVWKDNAWYIAAGVTIRKLTLAACKRD